MINGNKNAATHSRQTDHGQVPVTGLETVGQQTPPQQSMLQLVPLLVYMQRVRFVLFLGKKVTRQIQISCLSRHLVARACIFGRFSKCIQADIVDEG
jgi:hypothetical protein